MEASPAWGGPHLIALREQRKRQLAAGIVSGFVFTGKDGRPMSGSRVRFLYPKLLERVGLRTQPFHHLRHAYATLQLEAGEDLASISKTLGHSSLATTANIYAHLTPPTQQRMAERMDRILTG